MLCERRVSAILVSETLQYTNSAIEASDDESFLASVPDSYGIPNVLVCKRL